MNCPNCGAAHSGADAFCMRCGAKLTPSVEPDVPTPPPAPVAYQPTSSQPAVVAPISASAPIQASYPPTRNAVTMIRRVSAGSVFKVTFVIYALLLGLFGCVLVVIPGLLSASLLGGLVDDRYGLGALGGGIVGTLVVYVLLVIVGAFVQGLVTAIAALIYNLVAGWVGGVQVELQE